MKTKETGNVIRYLHSRFPRTEVVIQRKTAGKWSRHEKVSAGYLLDNFVKIEEGEIENEQ